MQKQLLKSVVARKIAETISQPIEEMTDRLALQALIQRYEETIERTKNDLDRRENIFATQDLQKCKQRVKHLDRYISKLPLQTPQLNLFQS
ncbi:hypothetical protein CKK33_11510 [Mucilaginibacter sp. MD40]|uniref:hypothetical protein n=1 Tax=Mucilaginibacter sp. MD40 TaxID=2029590 RepID=UPI000BACD9F6|nr:hypothetical protein [Mucilaginibacter sp. MD40]PAW94088.1 hypothetical protein CKK33_11510 [Mucilaginibacter sp. MD40]